MSSTDIGRAAEALTARELERRGWRVLSRNWRTRWCEIDIVARHRNTMYFVEVKYRRTAGWGDGLQAISSAKQRQMTFAAEQWIAANDWRGSSQLVAVSVSGQPPQLDDIIVLD